MNIEDVCYSIYGRMSVDGNTREGEWWCLKSNVPFDMTEDAILHYKKTWRYVERRPEDADYAEYSKGWEECLKHHSGPEPAGGYKGPYGKEDEDLTFYERGWNDAWDFL